MIEINGMAHVILTVSSFDAALGFYGRLMPFLGLRQVFQADDFAYWVGGRTALGIQRCDEAHRGERFVQLRVGLHHLCFRARSREDVDKAAEFLREIGATIVRGPLNGDWAPGYYYVLVEAFALRSTMFPAPACWRRASPSTPAAITRNPNRRAADASMERCDEWSIRQHSCGEARRRRHRHAEPAAVAQRIERRARRGDRVRLRRSRSR